MSATRAILVILLTLAATAAAGPDQGLKTGTITGCLTDDQTSAPIVGAWVAVVENNRGAQTDSTGCFEIRGLTPGTYNLTVTHERYGTVQGQSALAFSLKPGQKARTSVTLTALSVDSLPKVDSDESLIDKIGSLFDGGRVREQAAQSENSPSLSGPTQSMVRKQRGQGQVKREPGSYNYSDATDYSWQPHDMYFQDYGTNGFTDTRRDRFSTFATDVDDASYTLVRRFLQEGNRVPSDAVRVEEFINHFDYGYNVPGDEQFRVFAELTDSPFEQGRQIMKIAIKGREIERRERQPLNLTLVIDVSGSMGQGNRFDLVRRSARALVEQLNARDQVGIVAYGSNAYVALEPVRADRRRVVFEALDRLQPGGSTFAEAGIRLGYEVANRQFDSRESNIVVLCSDGVANVGRTSPDAIMNHIDYWAKKGISLNAYGYGMGNYNDVLLEQLAQKGNGRYGYINDRNEVRQTFVDDFMANTQILARDVKVQVEFDPRLVQSYRLLGYENRDVADHRFRDNNQDGGEVGAGHEVTALYELTMQSGKGRTKGNLATVFVRWKNPDESEVSELSRKVKWQRDHQGFHQARPELRLALVAGRFAEVLKGTWYGAETSLAELYRIAEPLRRDLPGEQTDELLDLIRRAGNLDDTRADWKWKKKSVYGNYKR